MTIRYKFKADSFAVSDSLNDRKLTDPIIKKYNSATMVKKRESFGEFLIYHPRYHRLNVLFCFLLSQLCPIWMLDGCQ